MSLSSYLMDEFNRSKTLGDFHVSRESRAMMMKVDKRTEEEISDSLEHTVSILKFITQMEKEVGNINYLEALKRTREVDNFMREQKDFITKEQERKLKDIKTGLAKARI